LVDETDTNSAVLTVSHWADLSVVATAFLSVAATDDLTAVHLAALMASTKDMQRVGMWENYWAETKEWKAADWRDVHSADSTAGHWVDLTVSKLVVALAADLVVKTAAWKVSLLVVYWAVKTADHSVERLVRSAAAWAAKTAVLSVGPTAVNWVVLTVAQLGDSKVAYWAALKVWLQAVNSVDRRVVLMAVDWAAT
jgi:hypothetical protein